MTHNEAITLEIKCNGGTQQSDYERDTLILELGYMTAFDVFHWDDVFFDGDL